MGRVDPSDLPYGHVTEVCGAGEDEVGGASLVCRLFVALMTGAARQEEPALETLAPRRRLMDEVACSTGGKERRGREGRDKKYGEKKKGKGGGEKIRNKR